MTATITDKFKVEILQSLFNGVSNRNVQSGDSDRYYMGIGRSQAWDNEPAPDQPDPSLLSSKKFQYSLQSVKAISDVSYVVPRYNWTSGRVYEQWDESYFGGQTTIDNPYYVITDEQNVYVCLKQGKNIQGLGVVSTFKPSEVTPEPFELEDGYVWKFLYNVGAFETKRYLTGEFIPVQFVEDSGQTVSAIQQKSIQNAAIPGQIVGIAIDSAGLGYSSGGATRPTITIYGDDSVQAEAYAVVYQGRIVDVVMKDDSNSSTLTFGSGYTYASAEVNAPIGSGALLRPIIAPPGGIGFDPRNDLASNAIMFNVKPAGDEGGTFITDNDFRQVGVIKNPLVDSAVIDFRSDSAFTALTGNALRYLQADSDGVSVPIGSTGDPQDEIVEGQSSGAKAIVDTWDADSLRLYVHQTLETGFKDFQPGEFVILTGGAGSTNIASTSPGLKPADVNRLSGEVLYIDNRSFVTRNPEQTEDIKVVIQI